MNKSVLQILKEISKITDSVILKYPVTIAASESNDVKVMVNLANLDENSFPDIGLLNSLKSFLSLYELFGEDKKVTYSNDTINITDGDLSSSFISSSLILMDAFNIDSDQFDKVSAAPSVLEFNLTVDDINKLNKASGTFKDLNEIVITSVDAETSISLGAIGKFNAKNNNFKIRKSEKSSKDFTIRVSLENFQMLPTSEYKVCIKYNAAKDSYRLLLESTKIKDFKIILLTKI